MINTLLLTNEARNKPNVLVKAFEVMFDLFATYQAASYSSFRLKNIYRYWWFDLNSNTKIRWKRVEEPVFYIRTVILSSLSSIFTPSFFHDIVGSGCPRGGWHSRTAGSPAATITSAGFCLKSSRRTARNHKTQVLLTCASAVIRKRREKTTSSSQFW